MKDPKTLPVKAYMNSLEYREFCEACVIARKISHSQTLRDLANDWARQIKSSEEASQRKSTNVGTKWALPVANYRINFGTAPVRLRV